MSETSLTFAAEKKIRIKNKMIMMMDNETWILLGCVALITVLSIVTLVNGKVK